MAKKINFSSIQKQANVQVIELNAYFIARTFKAFCVIENAIKASTYKVSKSKVNKSCESEEHLFGTLDPDHVIEINKEVLPFLKELVYGFIYNSKE